MQQTAPLSEGAPSLWLPNNIQDLTSHPNVIYWIEGYFRKLPRIVRSQPGVLIKFASDLEEEVICTKYARDVVGLSVPRILHHPPLSVDPPTRPHSRPGEISKVWYFCMEEMPGVSLDKVVDTFTPAQLDHVAAQLRSILSRMWAVKAPGLGSVAGGCYRNSFWHDNLLPVGHQPPQSVGQFIDAFRSVLLLFCAEDWTDDLLSRLPRNCAIRFTHGDLLPKNILVHGTTVTAIIDWDTAGFYPEFWEYCRMHEPLFMTPGWGQILRRIFPGEPRQAEINTVYTMLEILACNT